LSDSDNRAIVAALNNTGSFKALAWFCNEKKTLEEFELRGAELITHFQAKKAGSIERHTVYIFRKQPEYKPLQIQ